MRRWNLAGQRRRQPWERGGAVSLHELQKLNAWWETTRWYIELSAHWWFLPRAGDETLQLAPQKCVVVLCQFYVATSIHIFHHCSTMFIIMTLISIYFIQYLYCLPLSYFIYLSIFIQHTVHTRLGYCVYSVFIPLTVFSSFNSFYILFCRLCTLLFTLLLYALLVRS